MQEVAQAKEEPPNQVDFRSSPLVANTQSLSTPNVVSNSTNRTSIGICIGIGGLEPCTDPGTSVVLPAVDVSADVDVSVPLPVEAEVDVDVDLGVLGVDADVGICIDLNGHQTPCSSGSGSGHGSGSHGGSGSGGSHGSGGGHGQGGKFLPKHMQH